jgi:DNA-binding transcriptional ArsR family regulator
VELLDRSTAAEYASWFRALADPSRVQLVELLARQGEPMSVGQIVEAMGLAQSTAIRPAPLGRQRAAGFGGD